jgi:diguanylate cyclase (GGDEF)-like protein/PAS domain S-box-containing protein
MSQRINEKMITNIHAEPTAVNHRRATHRDGTVISPPTRIAAIPKRLPLWSALQSLIATILVVQSWALLPHYLTLPWLAFIGLHNGLRLVVLGRDDLARPAARPLIDGFFVTIDGMVWGAGIALFIARMPAGETGMPVIALLLAVSSAAALLCDTRRNLALFLVAALVPPMVVLLVQANADLPILIAATGLIAWLIAERIGQEMSAYTSLAHDHMQVGRDLAAENLAQRADIDRLRDDVDAGMRAQRTALREKDRAFSTLQALGEGVITTDHQGFIDYMNPVAEVLTGWNQREAAGQPLSSVFRLGQYAAANGLANPAEQCLITERIVTGDEHATLMRRDGAECAIEHLATPIHDGRGRFAGAALIFRDVTEKRELQSRLNWLASHDPLTGLINRREFETRLRRMTEHGARTGRRHVLCYIDLDRFKAVNDTCGHTAGDELLRDIAGLLKGRVREADTVARIGGDEFVALLYSCPMEKAIGIAEGLRRRIADYTLAWEGQDLRVGASIGLVEIAPGDHDLPRLLAAADSACYSAKNAGRDRIHVAGAGPAESQLAASDGCRGMTAG